MNPRRCVLTPEAQHDLESLHEYYCLHAPGEISDRLLDDFFDAVALLKERPFVGRPAQLEHERLRNARFVLLTSLPNLLVFYEVSEERVKVLALIDGRRDLPALFERRFRNQE